MTHFFASDVHLRLDRPHRSRRFAEFVRELNSSDTLLIAGDLCDFWFCTRQVQGGELCDGLRALQDFRQQGGEIVVLVGNHDRWMSPFYQEIFDATCVSEPFLVQVGARRVHVVHGHREAGRFAWKRLLETRFFFTFFALLPGAIANHLEAALMGEKSRKYAAKNKRLMAAYRRYVAARADEADLFVFGHVHERSDEEVGAARLVVLGDWNEKGGYLTVNPTEALVRQTP